MVKRLGRLRTFIFCMTAFLFAISLISAIPIKIKTVPAHEVQVTVADAGVKDFSVIQRFKATSDKYGDVSFNLDYNKPKINLYVYVKKDNETLISEKYFDYETEDGINIELAPAWFELIKTPTENSTDMANETENETIGEIGGVGEASVTEIVPLSDTGDKNFFESTGSTITNVFTNKGVYLWFIGIIAVSLVVFLGVKYKNSLKRISGDIRIKKLSELQEERKQGADNNQNSVEETENKIRALQHEINSLRNRDRIVAAERKLEQDQRELRALRGG